MTTTSTSTASLLLPSLTPKTLALFISPKPTSLSLFSSFSARPISLKSSFIRHVAAVAEFEQDEEEVESEPTELKLFVGNLPFNVDSAQLAEIFEGAGNVEMVEVIYDKMTGRSRGFGFVTMSSAQEIKAAARKFNGYELDGRQLRVNYGPPPPKTDDPFRGARGGASPRGGGGGGGYGESSNRLYVGNLAWGVDNLALENLFNEKGKVLDAKVVFDRDSGRSRGFGFVTYGSAEEMNSAIESLDGVDLGGRSIRVTPAEPRPPRRQF